MQNRTTLSKNLSIYLDFIRFSAALAVVLFHSRSIIMPKMIHFIGNHGGEAVIVFFVLSGFVIRFVVEEKETSTKSYAIARIARIYPVAVLAIILAVAMDAIGRQFNILPPFYENDYELSTFIRYLTFTNEIWSQHVALGSLGPYWSLGFEVMFYALFAGIIFLPPNWKVAFAVLWALFVGPKIVLFLSIWWIGVAIYDYREIFTRRVSRAAALAIFISTIPAYGIVSHYLAFINVVPVYGTGSLVGEITSYLYALTVAVIFSLNILSFDALTREADIWSPWVARAIRYLAGATFTLYLVHESVLIMIRSIYPEVVLHAWYGVAGIAATLVFCFVAAELAERRKRYFVNLTRKILVPSWQSKRVAEIGGRGAD